MKSSLNIFTALGNTARNISHSSVAAFLRRRDDRLTRLNLESPTIKKHARSFPAYMYSETKENLVVNGDYIASIDAYSQLTVIFTNQWETRHCWSMDLGNIGRNYKMQLSDEGIVLLMLDKRADIIQDGKVIGSIQNFDQRTNLAAFSGRRIIGMCPRHPQVPFQDINEWDLQGNVVRSRGVNGHFYEPSEISVNNEWMIITSTSRFMGWSGSFLAVDLNSPDLKYHTYKNSESLTACGLSESSFVYNLNSSSLRVLDLVKREKYPIYDGARCKATACIRGSHIVYMIWDEQPDKAILVYRNTKLKEPESFKMSVIPFQPLTHSVNLMLIENLVLMSYSVEAGSQSRIIRVFDMNDVGADHLNELNKIELVGLVDFQMTENKYIAKYRNGFNVVDFRSWVRSDAEIESEEKPESTSAKRPRLG